MERGPGGEDQTLNCPNRPHPSSLENCLCDFYRTTISSIHARFSEAHSPPFPMRVFARPIISLVYSKHLSPPTTPPVCRILFFCLHFVLCTVRQFRSIVVVVPPPRRQTGVFAVTVSDTLLSFTHYSSLSFPCRNNSPSTAAASPLAAAITPVCCAKSAFFALLPQLSSPSSPQQKSEPVSRFAFVFMLDFVRCTFFWLCSVLSGETPQPQRIIAAARRKVVPVGTKGQRQHRFLVGFNRMDQFALWQRPEPNRHIPP
jgi:hypothetical protein